MSNEGFAECLDIFSQFFIDPLLKEDMVTAELSAVDSEYRKNLSIEGWKDLFIQKVTMNQQANMSRFMIGNKETLGDYIKGNGTTLSAELKKFFHEYYSSNLMTVAI